MRAGQMVNRWAHAWGLTFFLLGIFHTFPAQAQQAASTLKANPKHHHYKVIDIGTFGGPNSQFSVPSAKELDNRGMASGVADTNIPDPNCVFDCFVAHAFVSKDGVTTDLGTLPGGAISFAYTINNGGLIVGQSQIGSIDPLTGLPELRGVLWRRGDIIDIGTLGGTASSANAINDLGQVVGAALTGTSDPFAMAPQASCVILQTFGDGCPGNTFAVNALFSIATTETHAFLWKNGVMQDLGTLGGPDSTALINNDLGQVAGWSYTSFIANPATGVPTVDPFFWSPEDKAMVDLGGLGGTFGAPFFMNNRGQVVGVSNLAGDLITEPFIWIKSEGIKSLGTLGGTFGHPDWINDEGDVVGVSYLAGDQVGHAFLWRRGVMIDLGTLGTDPGSEGQSINSQGQVVGGDGGPSGDLRGWLWEHGGPMVDLNELILPGSGITVLGGNIINDRGEIAAQGMLPNSDAHAILLIPCDENHPDIKGCDYSLVDATAAAGVVPGVTKHQSLAGQNALPLPQAGLQAGTVTLSPTHMYFGCHFGVGSYPGIPNSCGPETATLRNAGATPVYLQAITVGGQYFPEKNSCPLAPTALQPGQSCAITVSFNPRVARGCGVCRVTRTSTVDVYDTASGSPQSIALTGFISVN